MIDLIFKEQTYQLRGLLYEVHKRLGIRRNEETYHQATVEAFEGSGVPVASKARQIIKHRGVEVDRFECDLIAWDLIILELKVLPYTTFAPIHFAQLGHYLKVWNKRLGLLVDFGDAKTKIERVIWSQPEWVLK
ncbi:MAG: hypothetical protein Fur0022_13660 [Anaerolineales bacterium]